MHLPCTATEAAVIGTSKRTARLLIMISDILRTQRVLFCICKLRLGDRYSHKNTNRNTHQNTLSRQVISFSILNLLGTSQL